MEIVGIKEKKIICWSQVLVDIGIIQKHILHQVYEPSKAQKLLPRITLSIHKVVDYLWFWHHFTWKENMCDKSYAHTLISDEIKRATTKFPTWPADIIHAWAIVQEEALEALEAIHIESEQEMEEVVQTGAMLNRFKQHIKKYTLIPSSTTDGKPWPK